MATAEAQRAWRARHGARTGVRGRRPDAPCGTLAAHKRHVRHGQAPCDLCRLAARTDRQFRRTRSEWTRPDRFSWLVHRAVLDQLLRDPESVIAHATERLTRQRLRDTDHHEVQLHRQWDELLRGPLDVLAATMIGLDEHARQLRSSTPFVGVISEERRTTALGASHDL